MGIGLLKKRMYGLFLGMLVLSFAACGLRDDPEPVLDGAGDASGQRDSSEQQASSGQAEQLDKDVEDGRDGAEGAVAVADFYYMEHPYPLSAMAAYHYVINGEWIYCLESEWIEGDDVPPVPPYVSRSRISDGYHDLKYIVSDKGIDEAEVHFLLADGAGCCYLFWERRGQDAEEETVYDLEKYGAEGELLWSMAYTSEELSGMGSSLTGGLVTGDGRVFLHGSEMQGNVVNKVVFAFGEDGALQDMYVPDIDILDGIVEGKDGKVYGYGIAEKEAFLVELGGDGKKNVCPVLPLAVYSGHERGVCLHTEEGVWAYEPETGATELLWGWDDEYVQMNGNYVDTFFSGDGKYTLLYLEDGNAFDGDSYAIGKAAFVSLTFQDSKNVAPKKKITLSTDFSSETLERIVRFYNRYSKEYHVEIVEEGDENALTAKLLRGEGSDLIDVRRFYAEELAEKGVFEELAPYYETSLRVDREDILESVKKACTIRGKDVAVMPSFSIDVLRGREVFCTPEEWNVWKFLEMGQENRMFSEQNPEVLFQYCMGIRYGERFVDWEKRESHFDSVEFRRLLEECAKCKTYKASPGEDGEGLIVSSSISSIWDMVSDEDAEYCAKFLGYPGWEGGEARFWGEGMFAINSASNNKEGAWDFLEYLLSEEFQDMVDWGLPVRKSSFEARLQDRYVSPGRLALSDFLGEPAMPTETETELLREMAESALYSSFGGWNNPVWDIVSYEAAMYFSGDATLDETVRKIQNRMQLYLDEN